MKYGYKTITTTTEEEIKPGAGWKIVPSDGSRTDPDDEAFSEERWVRLGTAAGESVECTIRVYPNILAIRRRVPEPRYGWFNGKPIEPPDGCEIVPEGEETDFGYQIFENRHWKPGRLVSGFKAHLWPKGAMYGDVLACARRKQPAVPTAHSADVRCIELAQANRELMSECEKLRTSLADAEEAIRIYNQTPSSFMQQVAAELARAREKHPKCWILPGDGLAVLAVRFARLGEAVVFSDAKLIRLRLVQLAAMAKRFVEDCKL